MTQIALGLQIITKASGRSGSRRARLLIEIKEWIGEVPSDGERTAFQASMRAKCPAGLCKELEMNTLVRVTARAVTK